MKKLIIFLELIGLVFFNLNSYQPKEFNLFVDSYKQAGLGSLANPGQRSILTNNVRSNSSKIKLLRERGEDGSVSNVFYIKNVPEFLYFTTKKDLPVILNIYSGNNTYKINFQNLALEFTNKFNFLSINKLVASELYLLLEMFMKFEEIQFFDKFPIFLLIRPKSVVIENKLLNLNKNSLVLLSDHEKANFKEIEEKLALF